MPTFIEEKRQQIVSFIQERQTTIASGLAALLIIVVGFLIFNFFLRVNKDSSTTTETTLEATSAADVAITSTPTPSPTPTPTQTPSNEKGQVSAEGAAATNLPQEYTIQKGDTLGSISQKYYNSGSKWSEIAKANNLTNPNLIHPGNKLSIPKVETGTVAVASTVKENPVTGIGSAGNVEYIVSHGDTLWQIAANFYGSGFEWYRIKDANLNLVGTLPDGRPLIFSGQHLVIP